MATARAELSSINSTLVELTARVSTLAEDSRDGGDPDLAAALFTVERDLRAALRRLARAGADRRQGGR